MSDPWRSGPTAAERVAERLRLEPPWEVFAEEADRYEVYLNGTRVELVRGPIAIEGYGLRLLRPSSGKLATGFQASTNFSDAGIAEVIADAEAVLRHSEFPAAKAELPSGGGGSPSVQISDPKLWEDPARAVEEYVTELSNRFSGRTNVVLSFGAIRTTRVRTSLVNSSGLRRSYEHTLVSRELAIKASGGPEGSPAGEYWVDEGARRLETGSLGSEVDAWCRYAADARRAVAPPTGELAVVLPTTVLSGILPPVVGLRCSGVGRLRNLSPAIDSTIGSENLTIFDDQAYPWAQGSAPFDGEGTSAGRPTVIERGVLRGLLYDSLHAAAFGQRSTGNATRAGLAPREWLRFLHTPSSDVSTLVVPPGSGGSDEELIEQAGDGLWVQQLGWARPDPISGAFGGEIRIGYRIRHGKLAEPVRGGIVGGVAIAPQGAPSLLTRIAAVGARTELSESLASPACLVRPLTVAGN